MIEPPPGRLRALGILATAPVPGRVKPRLAEAVGPSTAAEVYWQVGRRVVSAVVGSGYRTTVWFRPAHEGRFVREWLDGVGRVDFRPQVAGSIAQRFAGVFARHFAEGAARVVLIGADCPAVDRRLVTQAFTALASHDVVLGPALDGGWYLLALRRAQPALFRGLGAPAGAFAAHFRARAQAHGLSCSVLQPLRHVDTADDARLLGLLNY